MHFTHGLKRLIKIWETLVYTESASTWLQLNSFSGNLSLHFLMQNTPCKLEMALEIETFQWTLCRLRGILGFPIMPPVSLLLPQLSVFVPCDTMLESSNISWHRFAHITAEHLWPCSPRGWHTALHAQDRSSERLPTTSKQEETRTLLFFSGQVLVPEAHFNSPHHVNTLPLSKDLQYLLPPSPQTCASSFLHFPPCTSASLILLHSLLPLFLDLP